MSGRARRPGRRTPPARAQVVMFDLARVDPRKAMLAAARAAGCTCSPDISVSDVEHEAFVYHDAWCALLRQGDRN